MLKLLIAVDGSDFAQRALESAARLAAQGQVEAVLLNVRAGPVYFGELPPLDNEIIDRRQVEQQADLLRAALAEAQRLGLTQVSTRAEQGSAATEIARVADELSVDQIVMGTHGRGAVGGLLMGSVAQRVVHLAKVPVLLVK